MGSMFHESGCSKSANKRDLRILNLARYGQANPESKERPSREAEAQERENILCLL